MEPTGRGDRAELTIQSLQLSGESSPAPQPNSSAIFIFIASLNLILFTCTQCDHPILR
jgi:hypothetical protein